MNNFRLAVKPTGVSFCIQFPNKYCVSFFIGECARDRSNTTREGHALMISSPDIECAALNKNGEFVETPWSRLDDVMSHMTSADVLELMNWVAQQEGNNNDN